MYSAAQIKTALELFKPFASSSAWMSVSGGFVLRGLDRAKVVQLCASSGQIQHENLIAVDLRKISEGVQKTSDPIYFVQSDDDILMRIGQSEYRSVRLDPDEPRPHKIIDLSRIKWSVEFTLTGRQFYTFVRFAESINDMITVRFKDPFVEWSVLRDFDHVQFDTLVCFAETKDKFHVCYSVDYLKGLSSAFKNADVVNFEIAMLMPMKIHTSVKNIALEAVLAPRIESD